jgi:hypothetical protein
MVTGLLILFIALSIYFGWKVKRQEQDLRQLEHKWRELQTEEEQVFDFLHGLGEAFGSGASHRELRASLVPMVEPSTC